MKLGFVMIGAACLALTACGDAGLDQMKAAATDAAAGAAKVAAQFVDTRTACLATGQNDAFCGCLSTRLGERLQPEQIDALAGVIRDGLTNGMQAAAERATNIDPTTRDAVVSCAATGAVGAVQAEAAEGASEAGQ